MSDLITEELDSMIRMSSVSDDYGTVLFNQKVCHARLVLIKEKLDQLKTRCEKLEGLVKDAYPWMSAWYVGEEASEPVKTWLEKAKAME